MARSFASGSSQYLEIDQAPINAYLVGFVCQFQVSDTVGDEGLMALVDQSEAFKRFVLDVSGSSVRVFADSQYDCVTPGSVVVANTWAHACGLIVAANDRRVFHNGGNKGTDSGVDATDPANFDRFSIGRLGDSSPSSYLDGQVAEAAIYDLSAWPGATASDKANAFETWALPALAAGRPPLEIPLGRVAYWPLIRDTDQDWVGGYHLTAHNAPTVASHPPMVAYPRPRSMVRRAVAVPVPVKMYYYRQRRT